MHKYLLLSSLFISFSLAAQTKAGSERPLNNKKVIKDFLEIVRSGKDPDRAKEFMADTVLAHQINSESPTTVKRTPQNYTDHVKDFLKAYGNFSFQITEIIAEQDKIYARWKQVGRHLVDLDGYPASGKELIEFASAVYRVDNGKIVEYWIQIDRLGFDEQLKRNQ
jgi:predicted ester cyclase